MSTNDGSSWTESLLSEGFAAYVKCHVERKEVCSKGSANKTAGPNHRCVPLISRGLSIAIQLALPCGMTCNVVP